MAENKDLESIQQARDLVERAYEAQKTLASFSQEKIDSICAAMSQAGIADSLRLGEMAVKETTYGIAKDKQIKNLFSARDVYNAFKNMRTVGVIRESESIMEIAFPRGVVAAIIPSTNPTSTAIFKCLISIKSRNGVVLSPHPSAAQCILESARIMANAAEAAGAPKGIISCMSVATVEGTEALMKHKRTAVILATGGTGLVRAAYSSGKPAFGVGPGNVPAFIEKTADVHKAVRDILTGKCFDNGTICASEQAIVADRAVDEQVRRELAAQGAYFLTSDQADKLGRVVMTPNKSLNPKIVGQYAEKIAAMAGITIPAGTRCMIAEVAGVGREYPLSLEKLSPILAYYVTDGIEQGCQRASEILHFGGMGHTASIHTRDRNAARQYGILMPAARVVVNTPSTHGAIGFSTDLSPSMTLGCGSWGGNVTSDNVSPIHLMDIKRVAFETREVVPDSQPIAVPLQTGTSPQPMAASPSLDRAAVSALVEKFLSEKKITAEPAKPEPAPAPATQVKQYAPPEPPPVMNGHKPVDFVSEEDVKRAVQKGERIYVTKKTIITPSARDLGDEKEVFAKV